MASNSPGRKGGRAVLISSNIGQGHEGVECVGAPECKAVFARVRACVRACVCVVDKE